MGGVGHRDQLVADGGDPLHVGRIIGRLVDTEPLFLGNEARDLRRRFLGAPGALHGHADRAALGPDVLDVDQLHAEPGKETDQRLDVKIRQVLMIDGVEQVLLGDVDAVLRFEDEQSVRREHVANADHQRIEIVDIGDHVVGDHDARRTVALQDATPDRIGEEIADGLDPRLRRAPRDLDGGIDAEHPHPALLEEAEQRSIVAAELDDQRARRDGEAADDVVGIAREVLPQAERERGGVDVVAVLDLRIADVENLQMAAIPAQMQRHRHRGAEHGIVDAGVGDLEVRRADRHAGHRDDQLLLVRMAEAASLADVEQIFHRGTEN